MWKKGHVKRHCSAQWKPSNRKIVIETNKAWAGLRSSVSEKPSSKPSPTKTKDPPNLTQTLRDSSHSPSVELCLGAVHQNSSVPQKSHQSDLVVAQQQHSSPSSSFSPSTTQMAYQRADPRPFTPNGFQTVEIQHREMMARAVVRQTQALHEDFAIVSVHPLPHNAMQFRPVREVVREFLDDHMGAKVRDIQPTHLGQALVQFVHIHDRDSLVNNSLHPYDDVEFSLVRHNQGRNWQALNFNRECWLMLMGFPLDYWNNEAIQSVLASFGRVIL
jgi:hypothetical protein